MFSRPAKAEIIWEPLPDITTFELASALKVLFAANAQFGDVKATFDMLPAEAQRHFRVIAVVA